MVLIAGTIQATEKEEQGNVNGTNHNFQLSVNSAYLEYVTNMSCLVFVSELFTLWY